MAKEFVTVRGSRFRLDDRDFPVGPAATVTTLAIAPAEVPQMAQSVLDTAQDIVPERDAHLGVSGARRTTRRPRFDAVGRLL